jgi:predicted  nucleic acid-binding Zn-ribbon protein
MSRSAAFIVSIVIFAGVAFVARVPAEQPAPIQAELLAEVRLLRHSIEALAGTNARVQIVFGRLQLQEQRTDAAAKRLDAIRLLMAPVMTRLVDMNETIKRLEESIADSRTKPEEVDDRRKELASARYEAERIERERARLAGEEAEAASALNQEQGRWSDLNRLLEELERALIK